MHGLISSRGELQLLAQECSIIGVQEHWRINPHPVDFDLEHFDWHASSAFLQQNSCGRPSGGVALFWRHDCVDCIERFTFSTHEHRLIAIRCRIRGVSSGVDGILIFSAYLPYVSSAAGSNWSERYAAVLTDIESTSLRYPSCSIVILCDGNLAIPDSRSDILISFVERLGLACVDIPSPHPGYTHIGPVSRSHIDHVLLSDELAHASSACRIHSDYSTSDHFPLSVRVKSNPVAQPSRALSTATRQRWHWEKCSDNDFFRYSRATDAALSGGRCAPETIACAVDANALDATVSELSTVLTEAARDSIPSSRPARRGKKKSYWHAVAELRQEMQQAHQLSMASPDDDWLLDFWKAARTAFQRECRRHERLEQQRDIERTCQATTQRGVWKSISSLRAGRRRLASTVDGVSGQQAIADIFRTRFATAMSEFEAGAALALPRRPPTRPIGPRPNPDISITIDIVIKAIASLNRGKAVGHDELANEHIVFGGWTLAMSLTSLFQRMLALGHVSADMRLGLMTPIGKNRRLSLDLSPNYRPISVSVAFTNCFENCLRFLVKPYLLTFHK